MKRITLASVVLLAVLAGCGRTASPLVTTSVPQAPRPVSAVVALENESAGRLEIRVAGLGGYRVQATTADVKTLKVTVSGGELTSAQTQSVAVADLTGGAGTLAFEDLPPGTLDVKIEALGEANAVLGTKTATATVVKGQTAVVDAKLKLTETHLVANQGNLEVDLALEDGDYVFDPIASASPRPTPSPTPAAAVAVEGQVAQTWFKDGTIKLTGTVRNSFAVNRRATLSVNFHAKTAFGTKLVETRVVSLGEIPAKGVKTFAVTSTKKVSSFWGDGSGDVTVQPE